MAEQNALPARADPLAARFGPWGEPFAVATYGELGVGKSLDALKAVGWWATVLTMPGGAKPATAMLGFRPNTIDVPNLDTVIAYFNALRAVPIEKRPLAVIIDDYSLQAKATARQLETQFADSDGRFRGDNSFRYYGAIKNRLMSVTEAAIWAGVHVIANGHIVGPEDKNGDWLKGGPEVMPRRAVSELPFAFHTILRADFDPSWLVGAASASSGAVAGNALAAVAPSSVIAAERRALHGGIYRCKYNNDYHEKDRHNIFRAVSPMNIGEGMRLAGYLLPRPTGLEWMESEVEAIAQALMGGADQRKTLARARDVLAKKHPEHLLQWALQDGRDRYELRRDRYGSLRDL